MRTRARLAAALVLMMLCVAPIASAQDSIASARQLYGSAAYEDALAMLDRIGTAPANGDAPYIEQYRALCLLALGRQADAEKAIEAVIASNPSYQPDPTTSPRVQAAFRDVRQKLLPGIAQQRYLSGRRAYDRKEYWSAIEQFDTALTLIGTPDPTQGEQEAALADMRTLIVGFRDLARAAMPASTQAAAVAQPKIVDAMPPPPPAPKAFYSPDDTDVTPPVALSQRMPRWAGPPLAMLNNSKRRGAIEVLITEAGLVEWAAVRQPTGTYYDQALVDQARNWKYSPAVHDGKAVKYRKVIQFTIQ